MSYGNKIISNLFMNETQAAINIYEFNILSDLHLFLHQMLIRVILETNYFYNLIVCIDNLIRSRDVVVLK